jgi:hypothetical protein
MLRNQGTIYRTNMHTSAQLAASRVNADAEHEPGIKNGGIRKTKGVQGNMLRLQRQQRNRKDLEKPSLRPELHDSKEDEIFCACDD